MGEASGEVSGVVEVESVDGAVARLPGCSTLNTGDVSLAGEGDGGGDAAAVFAKEGAAF